MIKLTPESFTDVPSALSAVDVIPFARMIWIWLHFHTVAERLKSTKGAEFKLCLYCSYSRNQSLSQTCKKKKKKRWENIWRTLNHHGLFWMMQSKQECANIILSKHNFVNKFAHVATVTRCYMKNVSHNFKLSSAYLYKSNESVGTPFGCDSTT